MQQPAHFGPAESGPSRLSPAEFSSTLMKLVGLCLLALVVPYAAVLGWNGISGDPEQWGQMGDYFGGLLNPCFAFLSMLAVCYTLHAQSEQHRETARFQAIERFESGLFELIRIHRENRASMQISFDNGDRERSGVEYLWYVWERIRLLAAGGDVPRKETLRRAYENAYEGYNHKSHLGHFFRNLYHIFRFIEDAEVLEDVEKERYAKLVRAQLSTPETAFLFMNGLHDTGRRFRRLIEKYALLQELQPADLPMDTFSKEDMLECYNPAAFFDREDMPAGVASENDGK